MLISIRNLMDELKRAKLETDGWALAGPKKFLHLSAEDVAWIKMWSFQAAPSRPPLSTSMGTGQDDQGQE